MIKSDDWDASLGETDDLKSSQRLSVEYIGIALGLFDALEKVQSSDPHSIAEACNLDPRYTSRWLEAAASFGLVHRRNEIWTNVQTKRSGARLDRERRIATVMQSIYSILIADAAISLFRSGERPGYSIVQQFHNLAPYYGRIGEALYGDRFSLEVAPIICANPISQKKIGSAADFWGGDGYLLRQLLKHLPEWKADIVNSAIPAEGHGRTRYVTDTTFLLAEGKYELILASRVVHHFGTTLDEKLELFYRQLVRGGALFIWEFSWPDDTSDRSLFDAKDLAFLNLIEHIQGNQFLTAKELTAALARAGFQTTTYDLANGREVLVEAIKQ